MGSGKWRFGRITVAAVLLGLVWMGAGYALNREKGRERVERYGEAIERSFQSTAPKTLAKNYLLRLSCAMEGDCSECHSAKERVLKIDCGYKVPHEFTWMLLPGMGKPVRRNSWGILAIPAAILYTLERAFATGGWLVVIPAATAVLLGILTMLRWKEKNWFVVVIVGLVSAAIYEMLLNAVVVRGLGSVSPALMVLAVVALAAGMVEWGVARLRH